MTLRALIVDDEALARTALLRLLKRDRDISVIGQCSDGESAVHAIQQLQPDLVFLDIQMPEMDGFQVLEAVGIEQMPVTIFVTAFDQYAVRAFDSNAVAVGGRIQFVSVADIDWIEAEGNYARLHIGRRTHDVRETLQALMEKLDPREFVRIHRSTIVNVSRVR